MNGATLWADGKLDWDYLPVGLPLLERAKALAPESMFLLTLPVKLPNPGERPAQILRIGGNVALKNLVRKVTPEYPADAKQLGVQGTVRVSTLLGLDGKVKHMKVELGSPELIESALGEEQIPFREPVGGVHAEDPYCRHGGRRTAVHKVVAELEVIVPVILPGVEQGDGEPGVGIDGCGVAAFVAVAEDTGVGEIFERGIAAVLAAQDVVDLMSVSHVDFLDQAVFTAEVDAFGDLVANELGNVICQGRE